MENSTCLKFCAIWTNCYQINDILLGTHKISFQEHCIWIRGNKLSEGATVDGEVQQKITVDQSVLLILSPLFGNLLHGKGTSQIMLLLSNSATVSLKSSIWEFREKEPLTFLLLAFPLQYVCTKYKRCRNTDRDFFYIHLHHHQHKKLNIKSYQ
jgi:hypothetical protein